LTCYCSDTSKHYACLVIGTNYANRIVLQLYYLAELRLSVVLF
jgi:hypothetical protein